jgi:hypothetical protein
MVARSQEQVGPACGHAGEPGAGDRAWRRRELAAVRSRACSERPSGPAIERPAVVLYLHGVSAEGIAALRQAQDYQSGGPADR